MATLSALPTVRNAAGVMFTLHTTGGEELARALHQLPEALHAQAVASALRKAAAPMARVAALRMARSTQPHPARPAKSGRGGAAGRHGDMGASHVADHIGVSVGRSGHSLAIGPGTDWWYWLFQEFGTVRLPAQPALRPAFDECGQDAVGILGVELWSHIRAQATAGVPGIGVQRSATFL